MIQNPRITFEPAVIPNPAGGYWAIALELWRSLNPSVAGAAKCETAEEAQAKAEALCDERRAVRAAEYAVELGELVETLPNGLQVRRKVENRAQGSVSLWLLDYEEAMKPEATRGPWRGSTHNDWYNRKGERVWRLSIVGGPSRSGAKTEEAALRELKRYAESFYPAKAEA